MILQKNLEFIKNHKVHLEEEIIKINREIVFFDKLNNFLVNNYASVVDLIGCDITNINFGVKLNSIYLTFKVDSDFDFYLFESRVKGINYLPGVIDMNYVGDFTLKIEIL